MLICSCYFVFGSEMVSSPSGSFIDFPVFNSYYNYNVNNLNWSAPDKFLTNLSTCQYSTGGSYTAVNCFNNSITNLLAVEGENEWSFRIRENNSVTYTTHGPVIFYVDTIAPTISIKYPLAINYSSNVLSINFTVTDANMANADDCIFSADGAVNTTFDCANGANTFSFSSADGINNWSITATDQAGNSNTASIKFFVDSIYPAVNFVYPFSSGYIGQNWIDANVSANDINLKSVSVYLYDAKKLINYSTGFFSPFYAIFSNLKDGYYYLNATAVDTVGHSNKTETLRIILDTTAPNISLVGPSSWNNSSSIEFKFIPVDNLNKTMFCSLYVNQSGTMTNIASGIAVNGTINILSVSLSDSVYLWTVECSDGLNKAFAGNNTIVVDTQILSPLFSPALTITESSSLLQAVFNETVSITSALFKGSLINMTTADNKTFSYAANGLGSGTYEMIVNATDMYSHSGSFSNIFSVSIPSTGGSSGGGGGGKKKVVPEQIAGENRTYTQPVVKEVEEPVVETPVESAPVEEASPEPAETNEITGAVVGGEGNLKDTILTAIIVLALITLVGILVYLFLSKKPKQPKEVEFEGF